MNAITACTPTTAAAYAAALGLVTQLVTHGTTSASVATRPLTNATPRRPSRQRSTFRLIDVIEYDPSSPNAKIFPRRSRSPCTETRMTIDAAVIMMIAPRGVP